MYCICSFESTLLSTHKIILEPKKVLTTAAHTESTKLCKKSINTFYKGRSKSIEMQYLMIESILSPLFYLHPHPHASTIFTKGYFTKSAHIALSVIKMNCWCVSVQLHKCAKSDSTLPISERMPSVRRMCLSLMYSHRVQCWQGSATLYWSWAWHMSKHCGNTVQKLTSPCWKHRVYTRAE